MNLSLDACLKSVAKYCEWSGWMIGVMELYDLGLAEAGAWWGVVLWSSADGGGGWGARRVAQLQIWMELAGDTLRCVAVVGKPGLLSLWTSSSSFFLFLGFVGDVVLVSKRSA